MTVENWFMLHDSRKLEEQVKYNIALALEGWLNGAYDEQQGYEPMTVEQTIKYIYDTLQMYFQAGDGVTYIGKDASKHLHFYGKENTMKLIRQFVDEYENAQPYILRDSTDELDRIVEQKMKEIKHEG